MLTCKASSLYTSLTALTALSSYGSIITRFPWLRVMRKRRARAAGIETRIGNHTFRPTGITICLLNGGTLEKAQQMAAHESPRTTKLYDIVRMMR